MHKHNLLHRHLFYFSVSHHFPLLSLMPFVSSPTTTSSSINLTPGKIFIKFLCVSGFQKGGEVEKTWNEKGKRLKEKKKNPSQNVYNLTPLIKTPSSQQCFH